ncbi:zinc ribbon domain-containing protein, partial [Staphylococcus warneri]|nr:zinc ribbon domain-containing protein [Staphylococcus warneri]
FKLALIIILLAFVLLYMISLTYILVKYSGVHPTKIASIYGIIIYQFVMMVMVYLLGHMIIQQIINDYLMKLFGSGFSGLL